MRLDTAESRRDSLTIHADHSVWIPTPYISFTTSPERIESLVRERRRRGPQTLTVIDPDRRMEEGLPILRMKTEMDHYGIRDPYSRWKKHYMDEYICLWKVSKPEIVGHCDWDDLVENTTDWYTFIKLNYSIYQTEQKLAHLNDLVRDVARPPIQPKRFTC
ncbi:hypothetical protein F4805DRAFT_458142 [Annulohypoxylon moriforme]|nr:hypothetical protein F4805DRAFT_458142 [Annulohypoxylon moriforme]